jgi:hypothetical protein
MTPRYPNRHCPVCGRIVSLTAAGTYRRHLMIGPTGQFHLCEASKRTGLTSAEHAEPELDGGVTRTTRAEGWHQD